MKQVLARIMAMLMHTAAIIALYLGLLLFSAHYFTWGLFLFILGLAVMGLKEEGWSP